MQNRLFMNNFLVGINFRHRFFIKLVFLTAAILLCGALDAPAQAKRPVKRIKSKTVAKNIQFEKTEKSETATTLSNFPVSVINKPEADYLSGEASVNVNPKQPTIVRLGLAQNAVSIVEFPASDGVYYIHEGNPKLVSVFQSPTRESDRSITIYPGEAFVSGSLNSSATITLQMRSGLILILEFVPVTEVRRNAHRCVINYDREEVIAARRAVGLAFNLGEDVTPQAKKNTRAVSKLIGAENESGDGEDKIPEPDQTPVIPASLEITKGKISRRSRDKKSKPKPMTEAELWRFVNKRLAETLKNPAKNLGAWSKSANGLSLAVSEVREIDDAQRLVIVAVRNDSASRLRLVEGSPELQILTVDEKGNPLQTTRLERAYVETTSLEGLILPGSVSYYAVVYNAPVMGVSQRLSVKVSHREAADSPATTVLPTINAKKE